jgi:hypothetical protein
LTSLREQGKGGRKGYVVMPYYAFMRGGGANPTLRWITRFKSWASYYSPPALQEPKIKSAMASPNKGRHGLSLMLHCICMPQSCPFPGIKCPHPRPTQKKFGRFSGLPTQEQKCHLTIKAGHMVIS